MAKESAQPTISREQFKRLCDDLLSGVPTILKSAALSLRLEGDRRRVHIRRFDHVTFTAEEEEHGTPSCACGGKWSFWSRPRPSHWLPSAGTKPAALEIVSLLPSNHNSF
jgi:hypothetical protein